jgi:hypothetical protein
VAPNEPRERAVASARAFRVFIRTSIADHLD